MKSDPLRPFEGTRCVQGAHSKFVAQNILPRGNRWVKSGQFPPPPPPFSVICFPFGYLLVVNLTIQVPQGWEINQMLHICPRGVTLGNVSCNFILFRKYVARRIITQCLMYPTTVISHIFCCRTCCG